MKTKEEIEQLAEKWCTNVSSSEKLAYKDGYTQCQEDNKDKKYTEEDMKKCWDACLDFNKPSGLDSGINYKDFINSLNKQD